MTELKTTSIMLTVEQYDRLRKESFDSRKSQSEIIREALELRWAQEEKEEEEMTMEMYFFRKETVDSIVLIHATADGWTNTFTPDGEVDTSLEHQTGIPISAEEARDILTDWGWEICRQCGKIYIYNGGEAICDECQKSKRP